MTIQDSVEWSGVPDSKVVHRGFKPTTLESETRDHSNRTILPLPIRLTSEINDVHTDVRPYAHWVDHM